MGQLVLGSIGSAAGQAALSGGVSVLGAHVSGAAIGWLIGAGLGGWIDRQLFPGATREGPRLDRLPVQASQEGAPIPVLFGRSRLAGQVIWASNYNEQASTSGGGKGGPRVRHYAYSISFAVGICEGAIDGIGRIWANGEVLDQSGLDYRLYTGSEDQLPDPLIQAIEGAEDTPAYRGLAYIVFEDLPLETFGNRIPNLSFEVFRSPGHDNRLEKRVRGVDLIPATGEFAYATTLVREDAGPGRQHWLNINNARGQTDFFAAIDDLEARLPDCRSVMLVSAWFGSDLRCGECEIRPGVEAREKTTRPLTWSVAGEDRTTAWLVSEANGSPAYGGTPADATLIEAIAELKARGFSVSLYPFILMDISAGNSLPDPYGGAEQAAYPWRGRITCHPARDEPATADQTTLAESQVGDFFGTASADDFTVSGGTVSYSGPAAWRFRRFILHHAALAQAAGGVDGFLIGSELRELTCVRGPGNTFPAVDALAELAGEARSLLGLGTRLSYAADWSEYFGFHPQDGSGDVFFHLDSLWSAPEIDAVAIDWYAPLADWRDGQEHLDASVAESIHAAAYLAGNIEGGEGYDWFYASEADRAAQIRTPITDGAYGKDWTFRFKDIRNWWAQPHHERLGGMEAAAPTSWVPESKPIWFTELGCPAIDKGANQPNVFVDPKSAESALPYFSTGERDDLIQRRYIEAVLDYWSPDAGNNPVSSVYGAEMIDPDGVHVWTWDARPFPDFPARTVTWADTDNWHTGHWLNGRAGLSPLELIVSELSGRAGLDIACAGLGGLVSGFVVDRPMAVRDALAPLMAAYGFSLADLADGAYAIGGVAGPATVLAHDNLVLREQGQAVTESIGERAALPRDVRIRYQLDSPDYRGSSVYARRETGDLEAVLDVSLPLLAEETMATGWARQMLDRAHDSLAAIQFELPPSLMQLEPGDLFSLGDDDFAVDSVSGLVVRRIEAGAPASARPELNGSVPAGPGHVAVPGTQPALFLMDAPCLPFETGARNGLLAAAWANPWPGPVTVWGGSSADRLTMRTRIEKPCIAGELVTALPHLPEGRWVEHAELDVWLYAGELVPAAPLDILGGANRLMIKSGSGWALVQFRTAQYIDDQTYRLGGLLAAAEIDDGVAADGAPVIVVDESLVALALEPGERGLEQNWLALVEGVRPDPALHTLESITYSGADIAPLAPAHLKPVLMPDGLSLSWIRRVRFGGDDWASAELPLQEESERYRIRLSQAGSLLDEMESQAAFLWLSADYLSTLPASPTTISVAQVSVRYGPGAAASCQISL